MDGVGDPGWGREADSEPVTCYGCRRRRFRLTPPMKEATGQVQAGLSVPITDLSALVIRDSADLAHRSSLPVTFVTQLALTGGETVQGEAARRSSNNQVVKGGGPAYSPPLSIHSIVTLRPANSHQKPAWSNTATSTNPVE